MAVRSKNTFQEALQATYLDVAAMKMLPDADPAWVDSMSNEFLMKIQEPATVMGQMATDPMAMGQGGMPPPMPGGIPGGGAPMVEPPMPMGPPPGDMMSSSLPGGGIPPDEIAALLGG